MGKRELLLIVAFVAVGSVVYLATAPATAPNEGGFSLQRLLEHIRRDLRGQRSSAELRTSTTVPVRPGMSEIRFETSQAPLTITGEDRKDIVFELLAWSNGYDETEAKKLASETLVKITETSDSLAI